MDLPRDRITRSLYNQPQREPQQRNRNSRREQSGLKVRNQQRVDRGVVNNSQNQRKIYRRQQQDHQNQPSLRQQNSESENSQMSQMSQMTIMTQQNYYDESLDIEEFILQNTLGECQKYRLPNRNIRISDSFGSSTKYQYTLRELMKLEIVSDVNRRIEEKEQQAFQKQIKVKLSQHYIFNPKIQQQERIIILKASNTRNRYYLQEILMRGRRLGIITRCLPFTIQNLQNKNYQTRLCFIGKDLKSGNTLLRVLDDGMTVIPQFDVDKNYHSQKGEDDQNLKPNQYYFMDLDSVITAMRQYRAVCDSVSFPLIKEIIGKKKAKGNSQQQAKRLHYMNSSNVYNTIKRQRNNAQLDAIKNIFKRQTGIYLIQGPPGTGKTQSIVNFASLQQHYFQKRLQDDPCNKIMICAQSNAAVNHIGRKILTDGLIGRQKLPNILRLGYTQQFDELLLKINLPHLCEIKVRGTQNQPNEWSTKLRWQKQVLQAKINRMMKEGQEKRLINLQKDERYYKIKKIVEIYEELKLVQNMKLYDEAQKQYLQNSQIILTTLNTSGNRKFYDAYKGKIRCLIIDEASQASEPSTLIPFNTLASKVILVGDHMQLQPTIMSPNYRFTKFNRSLFERLVSLGRIPYLLNLQYRMVQTLQQFPNRQFYQNKLKLGQKITIPYSLRKLQTSSMFFNIKYGKEERLKKSYQNQAEAYCVSILIGRFLFYDSSLKIGVIAPYKSQIKYLQDQIYYEVPMSEQERNNIRISTVDAFQGQQMDVIIISCVRANEQKKIGFVKDEKRMNVAITRAKYALFVFGHAQTLVVDPTWSNYINYHQCKRSFYDISSKEQCDPLIRGLITLQKNNQ